MKVLFLIRSLDIGGAQRQVVVLAKGLHSLRHDVTVVVFYPDGQMERELHEAGVRVIVLGKSGRWDMVFFFLRLMLVVRQVSPDVIYGFLGTANILTAMLKPLFPSIRTIWGVRASNVNLEYYDWLFRLGSAFESRLSRVADLIICNSRAGLEYAAETGFPRGKMIVIPNGIDSERFKPSMGQRERLRKEWGVAEYDILIGSVARLDPMKDHPTFLRAAGLLAVRNSNAYFVCVGDGAEPYRSELHDLARTLGLADRIRWVGTRNDVEAVCNALDFYVSSSAYGEGFSNSIAEAMACGVPCVVTDVGDSSFVVGDTGRVVPQGNPGKVADALMYLINESHEVKAARRMAACDRIRNEFSVEVLTKRTASHLEALLG